MKNGLTSCTGTGTSLSALLAISAAAVLPALLPACSDDGGSGGGDGGADAGTDGDADTDADSDSDTDSDTDTDADTDTGTDTDTGADAGPDADSGLPDTTLTVTLVPVAGEGDLSGDPSSRPFWGLVEEGPGEPWIPRDELGAADAGTGPVGEPTSVGLIWQITDSQIVDEESPARLVNGDFYTDGAFRLPEPWSTQLVEALVRTGNRFADARPFDFALLTGDMLDNIHGNELDWYVALMEGGIVDPDSGDDDDPIPGEGNDPHDPFLAEGIHPDVPWYSVVGNHDVIELGAGSIIAWMLADPTGDTTSWLSKSVTPTCLDAPYYADESPVPDRCYVPHKSAYTSSTVVPDAERAFISRQDWIMAHFDTASLPDGHGYTLENVASGTGDYVAHGVIPGVPSALVVVDQAPTSDQWGVMTPEQLEWLDAQLAAAEAEDEIIIVSSHYGVDGFADEGEGQAFLEVMRSHPNVIAHVAGHMHVNTVNARPAADGDPPAYGYWEILTASTLDWPQQMRFIEVVDNRDGTGDIYCTMVNYEIPEDLPLVEGGRFYSVFDMQSGGSPTGIGEAADRNVRLRFRWPPALEAMLAELPHRDVASFGWL